MLYANFGHNGMNYSTNTRTSSTFDSAQQNQWLINGILWLGGATVLLTAVAILFIRNQVRAIERLADAAEESMKQGHPVALGDQEVL